ncbi:MAG: PAS domain-containing protein [Myxococcaceae bacterium]|nr:PAS domain-containing protein [Myxococcaceae bacterium]
MAEAEAGRLGIVAARFRSHYSLGVSVFRDGASAFGHQVGLLEFDRSGIIESVNDVTLRCFGFARHELVGQHHRILVPASTRESPSYLEMWAALARGESITGQFERLGRDGRRRWLAGTYAPRLDAAGDVVGVMKLALDVTAFVQLRTQHAQDEALVLTMRSVADVVLNAMNGLRFAYDGAAERARLSRDERALFDQCFDELERTVRQMSTLPSFRSGEKGGALQLDYWSPVTR